VLAISRRFRCQGIAPAGEGVGRWRSNPPTAGHGGGLRRGPRGDAAEIGGVGLQTVRDWVLRFNAEGRAGLVNGKAPGSRPLPGEVERAPLRRIAEEGPTTSVHVVMRWRFVDLMQWVWEEFRLSVGL
jgi:Winged helix-turn helix